MLSRIVTRLQPIAQKYKLQEHYLLCRMDKPIGTLLLYYPCVWGTLLGQPHFNLPEALFYSVVFGVGAFSLRAAGCIVNDMFDRDIDQHVDRTKTRPLAAGTLTVKEALIPLAANLSMGLVVLTQLNLSAVLASFAIVPVAFLYPLAKRYFKYPQLVLGINFNWGIIVGALQTGSGILNPAAIPFYLGAVLQTITYDTIYAHQDVKHDKQLNLYSTAYTLPEQAPLYLTVPFHGLMMAGAYLAQMHPVTYMLLAANNIIMWREISRIDLNNPEQCGRFFREFRKYQLAICLILALGSYLRD